MALVEVKRDDTNIKSLPGIRTQLGWTILGKETHDQCVEESHKGPLVVSTGIVCLNLCNTNDSCNLYKHDAPNLKNKQPVDIKILLADGDILLTNAKCDKKSFVEAKLIMMRLIRKTFKKNSIYTVSIQQLI